jgi:hypothetical protein
MLSVAKSIICQPSPPLPTLPTLAIKEGLENVFVVICGNIKILFWINEYHNVRVGVDWQHFLD